MQAEIEPRFGDRGSGIQDSKAISEEAGSSNPRRVSYIIL